MDLLKTKIVHLSRCRSITRSLLRNILQLDPSLKITYQSSANQLSSWLQIPLKKAEYFYSDLHNVALQKQVIRDMQLYQTVTIVDEYYPPMLNTIKDGPIVLYAIGDIDILKKLPSLSVIGTRKPTAQAQRKMEIILPLIQQGWIIVSGMARGIDSFAHQMTLHHNGKTIAVLGGGFHHIYPREHLSLFHEITQKGLVLTEYPPDQPPIRHQFPERNRIISGLTMGTLVIEAMKRSGTLITVDQALDQGREVFAVPGNPWVQQTKGCHQMIQDGAKLVQETNDIIIEFEGMLLEN
ncbi:DNA processing protein (Smf family) [Oceanobacillus iheyensis HTE831]|uniref:DNA processing protein (Smf family) n=1 Tax=Oceanobacillus iheyensis (strain DSM 14371 / CIP 107618 / JCM 11309 / KCTC 3954 / HTE831) TaxID=221109 RepID=Q8EQY9_OCEIH|nr:DNA-processing protein DprA [Oceanobacillus iheyensis]BAC13501.1 DNA processing protein (Smf family) [Oceanobacillus iheyensis HTE831]